MNSSGQFTTFTDSVNAWSAGATAWLPVVLMLIAGALAAARLMAGRRGRPLGMSDSRMSAIMLGLGIASLVLIAIRWASLPRFYGTYFGAPGLATGARAGLILGLVSAILLTLLALRRMKVTRDQERRGAGWTGGEHGPLAGYRGGRAERGVTGRDREYAGRPGEEQQRGVTGEPGARSDRARGNPDFPGRDTGDRWNP
ncbi:MAG: hypothetical protein IRZ08_11425 [Frankia sp.]|nr:hypothetical protein [Frankia sp.]